MNLQVFSYFRTLDTKFYKVRVGEHNFKVKQGSEVDYDVTKIIRVSITDNQKL